MKSSLYENGSHSSGSSGFSPSPSFSSFSDSLGADESRSAATRARLRNLRLVIPDDSPREFIETFALPTLYFETKSPSCSRSHRPAHVGTTAPPRIPQARFTFDARAQRNFTKNASRSWARDPVRQALDEMERDRLDAAAALQVAAMAAAAERAVESASTAAGPRTVLVQYPVGTPFISSVPSSSLFVRPQFVEQQCTSANHAGPQRRSVGGGSESDGSSNSSNGSSDSDTDASGLNQPRDDNEDAASESFVLRRQRLLGRPRNARAARSTSPATASTHSPPIGTRSSRASVASAAAAVAAPEESQGVAARALEWFGSLCRRSGADGAMDTVDDALDTNEAETGLSSSTSDYGTSSRNGNDMNTAA
jgi:hypothetical protein